MQSDNIPRRKVMEAFVEAAKMLEREVGAHITGQLVLEIETGNDEPDLFKCAIGLAHAPK